MERVDISILGREYSLACPAEEKAALTTAAQHVSQGTEMVGSAGAGEWWWVHGFMD